jgi:hypothetical protein
MNTHSEAFGLPPPPTRRFGLVCKIQVLYFRSILSPELSETIETKLKGH